MVSSALVCQSHMTSLHLDALNLDVLASRTCLHDACHDAALCEEIRRPLHKETAVPCPGARLSVPPTENNASVLRIRLVRTREIQYSCHSSHCSTVARCGQQHKIQDPTTVCLRAGLEMPTVHYARLSTHNITAVPMLQVLIPTATTLALFVAGPERVNHQQDTAVLLRHLDIPSEHFDTSCCIVAECAYYAAGIHTYCNNAGLVCCWTGEADQTTDHGHTAHCCRHSYCVIWRGELECGGRAVHAGL